MNAGFLWLAKNDQDLVDEMKKAVEELWIDARKRETLYIAIEHNTKYLTSMSQTYFKERNEAQKENIEFKKTNQELNSTVKTMNKRFK